MEYYTYAYLREDGTPYYIGKGKCDRIYSKNRKNKPPKDKSRIIYLKQNLTEAEAFKHEIYMIAVFGRKDLGTGILHNLTDGGEGGSGYSHTEENKEYIKQIQLKRWNEEEKNKIIGKNNPFYGKTHSEENKIKIGIKSKERNQGFNNPRSKNWEIVFDNGKTVIINCMSIWCKNNGYNYSSIINVYRKLSKNHRGIVLVNQL